MHILYTHIYTMLVITHDMLYYAIPQNSFSPWLHEDTYRTAGHYNKKLSSY